MLLVVRNWSILGLCIAAIYQFLAYRKMFQKEPGKKNVNNSASSHLSLLLFYDILSFFGVFIEVLWARRIDIKTESFATGSLVNFLIFLIIGIFMYWYGCSQKKGFLFEWIGVLLAGSSIILYFCSNWESTNILQPIISANGVFLLYTYAILTIIWFLTAQISYLSKKRERSGIAAMTMTLFALTFLIFYFDFPYINELTVLFINNFESLKDTMFAWIKILPIAAVLIGLACTMMNENQKIDSYIYLFLGTSLLLSKLLFEHYFTNNFLILLIYSLFALRIFQHELVDKTNKNDEEYVTPFYLFFLFFFMVVSLFLIIHGLWLNIVVILVFFLYVYNTDYNWSELGNNNKFWYVFLIIIFAFMFIWEAKVAASKELFIMMLYLLILFLFILYILNQYKTHQKQNTGYFKFTVCMMSLFLFYSIGYRETIAISIDEHENGEVEVKLDELQNMESIDSAYYYWTDNFHNKLTEEIMLEEITTAIPIQGDKLRVVVTNDKGIQTTKESWYPFKRTELRRNMEEPIEREDAEETQE